MNEKTLQSKFIKWLKDNKVYYIKTVVASKDGTHDIVACVNGWFVTFECKGTGGKLSALQIYTADKIKKSGGTWYEVNPTNIELVKMLVWGKVTLNK
jgi:hypothetical protein